MKLVPAPVPSPGSGALRLARVKNDPETVGGAAWNGAQPVEAAGKKGAVSAPRPLTCSCVRREARKARPVRYAPRGAPVARERLRTAAPVSRGGAVEPGRLAAGLRCAASVGYWFPCHAAASPPTEPALVCRQWGGWFGVGALDALPATPSSPPRLAAGGCVASGAPLGSIQRSVCSFQGVPQCRS